MNLEFYYNTNIVPLHEDSLNNNKAENTLESLSIPTTNYNYKDRFGEKAPDINPRVVEIYSIFFNSDRSILYRNILLNEFKEANGIKLLKPTQINAIGSFLKNICSRYIIEKRLNHDIILNWKLSDKHVKDEQNRKLYKKFVNWYAGRIIHQIS
jgi:hypothetical protein